MTRAGMVLAALTLAAAGTSAAQAADPLYALYAAGRYDEAMHVGEAANNAAGYAIAARAAMADAAMQPRPCLDCLKRAEDFARKSVAADPRQADGHVWLAAALGLEGRITGVVMARVRNTPAEAKNELDVALKDDPRNPYALAAMGGWNIEIVRIGGSYLARKLYGAREADGLALFDSAVRAAPDNASVRYQIALSLCGFDAQRFRGRIESELTAAIRARPDTAYEKFIQGRAAELLALVRGRDPDALDAQVRLFQGYPV